VAFQTPIYCNNVVGRFVIGTFPPLSRPQYPLLTFLFVLFSGLNPKAFTTLLYVIPDIKFDGLDAGLNILGKLYH